MRKGAADLKTDAGSRAEEKVRDGLSGLRALLAERIINRDAFPFKAIEGLPINRMTMILHDADHLIRIALLLGIGTEGNNTLVTQRSVHLSLVHTKFQPLGVRVQPHRITGNADAVIPRLCRDDRLFFPTADDRLAIEPPITHVPFRVRHNLDLLAVQIPLRGGEGIRQCLHGLMCFNGWRGNPEAILLLFQSSCQKGDAEMLQFPGIAIEHTKVGTPGNVINAIDAGWLHRRLRTNGRRLADHWRGMQLRHYGPMAAKLGMAPVVSMTIPNDNKREARLYRHSANHRSKGMDKAKERMIRVLIVDDVKEMRESLRRILVAYPGMEVIGEACDGEEAILRVHQLKPSVVVMDINMPRLNGIKATARIKQAFPHVVIIGISVYATDDTCQIMRAAGAATVITKEAAVDQLRDEIVESVNRRSTFFH